MSEKSMTIIVLLAIIICSFSVMGYETRVNISITETVFQNTTFGEFFNLSESTTNCLIEGRMNISNPSSTTVSDINITLSNIGDMNTTLFHLGGRNGSQQGNTTISDTINWSLHIPELRENDTTLWGYNLSCSDVPTPLNINTKYATNVAGIQTKVLAGKNFTVWKEARNDVDYGNLTDVNVIMETQSVKWNGTDFNFTFLNISPEGDYANVNTTTLDGGANFSNRTWYWGVNGGNISMGENYNITFFTMTPYNVPTSSTYLFLKETLSYQIDGLASGVVVENVKAVSELDINLEKQIIRPAENESSHNVTWQVDANISTPIDILYNVTSTTVWVSKNISPITYETPFGRLNNTYASTTVNRTDPFIPSSWTFNYTDGSSSANPPPIVWIKPYFHIFDGNNQIMRYNLTQNGSDYYLSYIYVVNGYWLQVDKNITNVDEDRYKVDLIVENIGNAWTPQDLAVTVYDFVPNSFDEGEWTDLPDSSDAVNGVEFNGTAYRWHIEPTGQYNASLGPANGPEAVSIDEYRWNATYYVNGTGEYEVSQLYVVGLDPMKIEGAGAHEGITVISNFASHTKELFYAIGVLALVVLNIVNFMMTRNINRRLKK